MILAGRHSGSNVHDFFIRETYKAGIKCSFHHANAYLIQVSFIPSSKRLADASR